MTVANELIASEAAMRELKSVVADAKTLDLSSGAPWLTSILRSLCDDAGELVPSKVCAWLGIPYTDDCPRPGDARAFELQDWKSLLAKLGYDYKGDSAHSFQWEHAAANLIFGTSKTSSDFRAPMAAATQLRRSVRGCNSFVMSLVRNIARQQTLTFISSNAATLIEDEQGLRTALLAALRKGGEHIGGNRTPSAGETVGATVQVVADYTVGQAKRGLLRIERKFGITPKKVLSQLIPLPDPSRADNTLDMLWTHIKTGADNVPVIYGALLRGGIDDFYDELAVAEQVREDEKRKRRDARAAARTMTPLKRERAVLASQRRLVFDRLSAAAKAANDAVSQMRYLQENLPAFEITLDDPTEALELAADAKAHIEELESKLAEREEAIVSLRGEVEKAEAASKQLAEQAVSSEQLKHVRAYLQVVQETVQGAGNLNPFAMVSAFSQLAVDAAALLQKIPA